MARTATEAVKAALSDSTNVPGTCQLATRTWLGAPSVGDVDGDGDADAVDGWQREPAAARHTDRKPPAGAPVAWSGGRKGYGHRALSLGPIGPGGSYMIRTTDGNGEGRVATRPLEWVQQTWGLTYLGWSETISGQPIPGLGAPAPVTPPKPAPRPARRGVLRARLYGAAAHRFADHAARALRKSKDPRLVEARTEFAALATRAERAVSQMPTK